MVGMRNLLPKQAQELLRANPKALFIDCRSDSEFFMIGHCVVKHADGSEGRPELVMWSDEFRMVSNPHFVAEVGALSTSKDQTIVIICRSGRRSALACNALQDDGFTDVVNVLHGFEGDRNDVDQRSSLNGWRFDGLDWEQM